jgi:hypothetical protein|tara:strand:- start:5241 stop:5444 length:204 start_codon:yes stop_codon:yes gene_type:complete
MTTSAEHFKLVNESTFQGNLNTGQAIDPYRRRLDEKQQFAKMKKLEYNSSNFIAEQTSPQSNYGRLK